MNERWKQRDKPVSLDARFECPSYDTMRAFLDEIADHAERLEHHPNISFARDHHVSVVIYSTAAELQDVDRDLATSIDESYERTVEKADV